MTVIPLIFGYPLHVWLGMILFVLMAIQIFTGIMTLKGKMQYFKVHRLNVVLIMIVMLLHMYYGLGLWFFNFTIK